MPTDALVEIYRLQVARRRLSCLVDQVASGASVVIARHDIPIVKMLAVDESPFHLRPPYRVLR